MTLRHVTLGAGTSIGGSEPVISDAVRARRLLVFLSGRAPVDPATLAVLDGGFDAQAQSVLADIDAVLAAGGSSRVAGAARRVLPRRRGRLPRLEPRSGASTSRRRGRRGRRSSPSSRCPGILIELQVTAGVAGGEA